MGQKLSQIVNLGHKNVQDNIGHNLIIQYSKILTVLIYKKSYAYH